MPDYPLVALDFMNRNHAEFAALRNQLLGLLNAEPQVAEVDESLNRLLEHTRLHFSGEERLMLETHFPPYPVHKAEHDGVLTEMKEQIERWKQARDTAALRDWLDRAVGDWFVNHVRSMDFVTAAFIEMKLKAG